MPTAVKPTSISTTTSVTGRRRLAACLFSIAISTGITAGAAASVADLVPSPPFDGQLIAIGAEARKLGAEYARLLRRWWDLNLGDPDLERAAEEMDAPHELLCDLSDRAVEIPAVGPDGWKAKAELLRHFLIIECESEGGMVFNGFEQELAWSLVCDMTGRA